MISKNLSLSNSIPNKVINIKYQKNLNKKYKRVFANIKSEINNQKFNLNVLSKNFKFNFKLNEIQKFKKFKSIVIIGMGGSVLGSEAVYSFLKKKVKKNISFLNNLDQEKLSKLEIKSKKQTLFIIISKSGNTIETLVNFLYLKVLKKNAKNLIIISEENNNILYSISKKYNLFFIQHKKNIGGRFSVLSEVGVVPAFLMGLNIDKLRFNLEKYTKNKDRNFLKKSTIDLSNIILQKKITNLIYVNYSPKLQKLLNWCQQLIAESLGKKGKGLLPLISAGPRDHHSLLQLYLDGPKNNLFHIFCDEEKSKKKINSNIISNKIKFINKKSIDQIKKAQKEALIKTLKKNKIPFREFKIKKFNEETIGELFSYYILETIVIGKLINVNPHNQPAVEQVKALTKKLLK